MIRVRGCVFVFGKRVLGVGCVLCMSLSGWISV